MFPSLLLYGILKPRDKQRLVTHFLDLTTQAWLQREDEISKPKQARFYGIQCGHFLMSTGLRFCGTCDICVPWRYATSGQMSFLLEYLEH